MVTNVYVDPLLTEIRSSFLFKARYMDTNINIYCNEVNECTIITCILCVDVLSSGTGAF
jgi:hypothetical protein